MYESSWIIPNHQVNLLRKTIRLPSSSIHSVRNVPSPPDLRRLPPTPASRDRAPPGTLAARPPKLPSAAPATQTTENPPVMTHIAMENHGKTIGKP